MALKFLYRGVEFERSCTIRGLSIHQDHEGQLVLKNAGKAVMLVALRALGENLKGGFVENIESDKVFCSTEEPGGYALYVTVATDEDFEEFKLELTVSKD